MYNTPPKFILTYQTLYNNKRCFGSELIVKLVNGRERNIVLYGVRTFAHNHS